MSPYFETTSWSTVLAAKDRDAAAARAALDALCRTYWPPLYAHLRQKGYGEEEAKDLTQEFFARLLARDFLGNVDQGRGRFRSFLLVALNHFLANEWEKRRAKKRGGAQVVMMDLAEAERIRGLPDTAHLDARQSFDRKWANKLLETVLTRLCAEYRALGKGDLFEALKDFLAAEGDGARYREASTRVGMTEGAVKVAVHRLRKRYGTLLYAEVSRTVADPAEVEEELRYLIEMVAL